MGRACFALVAAAALLASTPALAACGDEVTDLERRLQEVEATSRAGTAGASDEQQVEVKTSQAGEVAVEAEEGGAEPAENWFGASPSIEGARAQIDSARAMASDGNEEGCAAHLDQAREIIEQLES